MSNPQVKYVIHEESGTAYAAKIVSKHKAPPGYMTKFLPREIASLKKVSVWIGESACNRC